jgi:hypothetical protein
MRQLAITFVSICPDLIVEAGVAGLCLARHECAVSIARRVLLSKGHRYRALKADVPQARQQVVDWRGGRNSTVSQLIGR